MNDISIATVGSILSVAIWFFLIFFDLIMIYAFIKKRKEKEKDLKLVFPLLVALVFTSAWLLFLRIASVSFCCGITNLNIANAGAY
jgi:hypothetical protein